MSMKIPYSIVVAIASTTFVCSSCINQGSQSNSSSGSTKSTSTLTGSSGASPLNTANFTMTKATATPPANGGGNPSTPPDFTLIFNANNLQNTLNDVCRLQSGGNIDPSKACSCRYSWTVTSVADSSPITRTIDTDLTQVTNFQVNCPGPDIYYDDTEIPLNTNIKIQLVPNVAKGNNSGFTTNFVIFPKKPVSVSDDFHDIEGNSFRNIFHYVCYDKRTKKLQLKHSVKTVPQNNGGNAQQIKALVANSYDASPDNYSGQSYFYDFYVRSNELGTINTGNAAGYTCPQTNVNGLPQFFPLDSQFALALQSSSTFPVPVLSQTIVPLAKDPNQSSAGFIGYAAKPNADGSCPPFTIGDKKRFTYRLRKLTAIYPLRYNADGDVVDLAQPSNTIYVLDRPVNKLGQDSSNSITRLGPKPCPFSFKTSQFGQRCSTDASLAGWSVDGTQIDGNPACPIYPPVPRNLLKQDGTLVIRPYQPFLPHYLEDTRFKACAFQPSTAIDPEIVLSHDDAIFPGQNAPHDFYCAKYYPSAGQIIPPPNGDPFDKAPGDCDLGASAAAIKTDRSFSCARTFDPSNSGKATPSAGCCQICSGSDCSAQGGGKTAPGRNAAFNPPSDMSNPPQSIRLLPRGEPNKTGGTSCFDPYED